MLPPDCLFPNIHWLDCIVVPVGNIMQVSQRQQIATTVTLHRKRLSVESMTNAKVSS